MSNLNDKFIRSLKIPKSKHKIYWDKKTVGLGIRITNKDTKSFVLRYVVNGRERKYTIGKYPDLTVTATREIAIKLKGEIVKGNDSLDIRQSNYKLPTFKELAEEYLKINQNTKRAKTISEYTSMINKYLLPKFGNYKLEAINKKDIEKLHISLSKIPYRANRILQLLLSMFNSAISWEWTKDNPAKNINKFKEEKRYRFLSEGEIKNLFNVLKSEKNQININIIKLILLTGSRKGEVFSARWQDFDFESGIWIKPASLTKQNRTSYIPLNKEALKILEAMKQNIIIDKDTEENANQQIISNETYLFYNTKTKSCIQDIKRFWRNICKKAKIENIRIHDLRHTFASTLVNDGVGLEVIGKLVGHSSIKTTERYSHLINSTLRQATEMFGIKMDKIENSYGNEEVTG